MSFQKTQAETRRRQREREDARSARRAEFQINLKKKQKEQEKKDARQDKLTNIMYSEGKVNAQALAEFRAFYMREVAGNKKLKNLRENLAESVEVAQNLHEDVQEELAEAKALLLYKQEQLEELKIKYVETESSYEKKLADMREELVDLRDFSNKQHECDTKLTNVEDNKDIIANLKEELEKVKKLEIEDIKLPEEPTLVVPTSPKPRRRLGTYDNESRRKNITLKQGKVKKLNEDLQKENEKLEKVTKEYEQLEAVIQNKQETLTEVEQKYTDMRKELRELETQKTQITDEIATLNTENERIKRRIERASMKSKYRR